MKKIYGLLLLLLPFSLSAQDLQGDKIIGANIGFSLTGGLVKAISSTSGNGQTSGDTIPFDNLNIKNTPAFSAIFDYSISDKFSLGGLVSTQIFNGSLENYQYKIANDSGVVESVSFKLNRLYFGIAPKFHYQTANNKLDIYSALRIGYILWVNKIETSDARFNIFDRFSGGRPAVGIVPIGIRYNFTDQFGGNFESAIAAPYVFSVGLHYKL